MDRPRVSVIVPFHGDEAAARATLDALRRLALGEGDELLIADNTPAGVLAAGAIEGFRTRAEGQPYSARNEGAERARGDWLLFTDADCRPEPGLLDAYFDPPPGERIGALAGEIAAGEARTLAQRYAADRRLLSSALFLAHPYRPMGVTANLLVRREAFEAAGGFHEGIRSGGDADLCWRLQDLGWEIEHRPGAVVVHDHRATVGALLRQAARTAAGTRWLEARHAGFGASAGFWGRVARAAAGVVAWPLRGRPERGAFKAVELLVLATERLGRLAGNARDAPVRGERVVVDEDRDGEAVHTERLARPSGPRALRPGGSVAWAEDDGVLARLRAAAIVGLRHPLAARRHRALLLVAAPAALRARGRPVEGRGRRAEAIRALSSHRRAR